MGGLRDFSGDDLHCVYCNAKAAGQWPVCKALCRAPCADLVMGLVTMQAVCRSCIASGFHAPTATSFFRALWPVVALVALTLAVVLWLLGLL